MPWVLVLMMVLVVGCSSRSAGSSDASPEGAVQPPRSREGERSAEERPPPRAPMPAADDSASRSQSFFVCSMHPQIREAEPGTCSICGMDLLEESFTNTLVLPEVGLECGSTGRCLPILASVEALVGAAAVADEGRIRALATVGLDDLQLIRALDDDADEVRSVVALEVGRRGLGSAIGALRRASDPMLHERSEEPLRRISYVVAVAMRAELGDPSAAEELVEWVANPDEIVSSTALAYAAIQGISVEEEGSIPRSDWYATYRRVALAELGDEVARQWLLSTWDASTYRARARLRPKETSARIEEGLAADPPFAERVALLGALVEADPESARRHLHRELQRVSPEEALLVLGLLASSSPHRDDQPAVFRFLQDPDPWIRVQAAALWLRSELDRSTR